MNIQSIKEMIHENTNENISLLIEVLDLYEHDNKLALKNLFATQSDLINDVVLNVLMIYSLLSFIEDKKELEFAQKNIAKLIKAEPLVKDILAIYLQLITIENINPNMKEEQAKKQNKKLVEILTSY